MFCSSTMDHVTWKKERESEKSCIKALNLKGCDVVQAHSNTSSLRTGAC